MNDAVLFYLGISPLSMVFSARTIAMSRNHRRLPKVFELLWKDIDVPESDQKWLRIANRVFFWWALLFIAAWLMDVSPVKSPEEAVRGVVGLSVFHLFLLGKTLRAARFNIYFSEEECGVDQENARYWNAGSVFPGFGSSINSAISLTYLSVFSVMILFVFHEYL